MERGVSYVSAAFEHEDHVPVGHASTGGFAQEGRSGARRLLCSCRIAADNAEQLEGSSLCTLARIIVDPNQVLTDLRTLYCETSLGVVMTIDGVARFIIITLPTRRPMQPHRHGSSTPQDHQLARSG